MSCSDLSHLQKGVVKCVVTLPFMPQDTVNFPVHLKNFNLSQLRQLCKELRSDIVHTVSKTGGASPLRISHQLPAVAASPRSGCKF